jgi:hypothetical protein
VEKFNERHRAAQERFRRKARQEKVRGFVPPHADVEDEEAGTGWTQLTPEQLADWRWTAAIETADSSGYLRPLAECFRAGVPQSDEVRAMLADLLTGRRLSPNYPFSPQQQRLLWAHHRYKHLRLPGESNDEAFARVAREDKVKEETLREFDAGKGPLAARLRRDRKR